MKLLVAAALALVLAIPVGVRAQQDNQLVSHSYMLISEHSSSGVRVVDLLIDEPYGDEVLAEIAEDILHQADDELTVRFYVDNGGNFSQFASFDSDSLGVVVFESYSAPRGNDISRSDYGDKWPFTIDSGELDCRPGPAALFITDSNTYQLNGVARQMGYASIDPIWRSNPAIPGSKISLSPIIRRALTLCD